MKNLVTNIQTEDLGGFLTYLKDTFEISWNEISLGEEIVGEYINFCENRKHFRLENWTVSNRQFRYLTLFKTNLCLHDIELGSATLILFVH